MAAWCCLTGRLTSLDHNLPGTANDLTFTYTYNPAFQIKTRNTSNSLYIYDDSDGSLATPANGVDRYTTVGGTSTSYNANGDFLSGGVAQTYSYNANSELTGITGGTASTLAYGPAGRLIRQTGTQDSAYLFDGTQVIAAFNGATGGVTQRFVPSDWTDERAGVLQGNVATNPNWASIDERGTVLNTHTASAMTGINTYDAYGQPGPGNIGRFGYTGQMWLPDAQAWHYKARAYHPGIGRFLQTDPIGYEDGLNLYGYVGGDSINWIDSLGLIKQEVCTTPTGTKIRRCVTVETGDEHKIAGSMLREIESAFARFIASKSGADLSRFGKNVTGLNTTDEKRFFHIISQFVGFAIHKDGHNGAIEQWSRVTAIHGARHGTIPAAIAFAGSGNVIVFTNSWGDEITTPFAMPSDVARLMMHEAGHVGRWGPLDIFHYNMDLRARVLMYVSGLDGGGCVAGDFGRCF